MHYTDIFLLFVKFICSWSQHLTCKCTRKPEDEWNSSELSFELNKKSFFTEWPPDSTVFNRCLGQCGNHPWLRSKHWLTEQIRNFWFPHSPGRHWHIVGDAFWQTLCVSWAFKSTFLRNRNPMTYLLLFNMHFISFSSLWPKGWLEKKKKKAFPNDDISSCKVRP